MAKELPAEIGKLDALELENLQLKAERAQAVFEGAVGAFQARMRELGERYKFDSAKDVIHFASRKIERR
jgi:hypothetical protein